MSNDTVNYGPTDDTPSDLLLEKTFLISGYLTGVGYVNALFGRGRHSGLTKMLIPYLTILCAMNTIWTATSAYGLQLTFIDNRNYPGSVIAFLGIEFALTSNVISLASYITGNIMADALMIWRCYIVWAASTRSKAKYAILLPCLMLTGSLGLFGPTTAAFATPYFAVSMILNIVVTVLITFRILFYKRRGTAISAYNPFNLSVVAIFIESAALYSVISLLLLVTFALGHPINQIWLGVSPSVQVISNYLIVYRVARGQALGVTTDFAESQSDVTSTAKNEAIV
ncbi:hypothetical protein B0H10DRAFT_2278881 [Mycena sp. CBHHK59/15]|nr:hypothetical protein B0H10DRAFT_2278881 [Mycena sp. CBHHK59/15]